MKNVTVSTTQDMNNFYASLSNSKAYKFHSVEGIENVSFESFSIYQEYASINDQHVLNVSDYIECCSTNAAIELTFANGSKVTYTFA